MLVGLGHVDLVCSDVELSLRFYAAVFGPLGLEAPVRFTGEQGETINYLRFPGHGSGSLGLRQASVDQAFELYAPGFHHLALAVESRDDVDRAHAAAQAEGAEILHAPRTFPEYHDHYYGAFVRDPDGHNIEAVCHQPEA